jgi:sugar transferase (PEP-CTERM/EpsH1 system associated)
MRILYIVPYLPNPIRTRPYNLIRELSVAGNEVTVVTLVSGPDEESDLSRLRALCHRVEAVTLPRWRPIWNSLGALLTDLPLQAAYSWEPRLAQEIQDSFCANGEVASYDVVHVEHLRGARYALWSKACQQNGPCPPRPVVWDSVDCISQLFRQAAAASRKRTSRWVTRFELGRTERYERWLLQQFDRILVTSAAEREAFLALLPGETAEPPLAVLPNGVDLHYFTPGSEAEREPATIALTGKMSYHANTTMAVYLVEQIMPHVWAERPDAEVWIVGKDPPRQVMTLAEHPRVTVTGTVPDVRPYLQRATMVTAPMVYGAGIQNKVLEAMACSTPVVATSRVLAGLTAKPEQDLLVADGAKALAGAILSLLGSPESRRAMGAAGRRFVEANYSWTAVAGQLQDLYRKTTIRRP